MVEGAVEYLQSGSLGTIVTCMAARRPLACPGRCEIGGVHGRFGAVHQASFGGHTTIRNAKFNPFSVRGTSGTGGR